MKLTRNDLLMLLGGVSVGFLTGGILWLVGFWFHTPVDVVARESVRTGGAMALLMSVLIFWNSEGVE